MPSPTRKGIFIVLLAMCLVVGVGVVPDKFGEGYQRYLLIGALLLVLVLLYFTKWPMPGAAQSKAERFNIPPGTATRRLINLAKAAIGEAEPEKSLQHLSGLKVSALDTQVVALNGRYSEYRRNSRLGLLSTREETLISNQIKHDILDLVKALEDELATGSENYKIIKEYLKKRYTNRLGQKLAKRQPVNLRRIPSTEGTTKDRAEAFIAYNSDEVAGTMAQTFRDARSRLLLIGAPGAGKTTLMLQLVLDLLDSEPDALPVLLNLATWSSEYIALDAWLKKILPAELGVSEKYAQEIMQQGRLILLLDGFDEIREVARADCLEAIGRYGEDGGRQFVISSRIEEYKAVAKDAPVYWQIEVGPLSIEQLESELNRLWETENQPEAQALLQAIQKDTLLRQAAETPFYFNTLQILFSSGKTLTDLHFTADTLEGRQAETLERFIEYELKAPAQKEYPSEKIKYWLSFLASRMTQRNMVVFELRELQYDWWIKWQKGTLKLAILLHGWIFGFVAELSVGLVFGVFSIIYNASLELVLSNEEYSALLIALPKFQNYILDNQCLLFGLSFLFGFTITFLTVGIAFLINPYNTDPKIIPRERLFFNKTSLFKFHQRHFSSTTRFGIRMGIFAGIFSCFIIGNLIYFTDRILVGVIVAFFVGLFSMLIASMGITSLLYNLTNIIQISSPYQRFTDSLNSLNFSILQHILLRYQLYRQGILPLRLVDFLNEFSLRHLLEFDGDPTTGKGGGAWRFRHRILQEWFAEKWVEPEGPEKKSAEEKTDVTAHKSSADAE